MVNTNRVTANNFLPRLWSLIDNQSGLNWPSDRRGLARVARVSLFHWQKHLRTIQTVFQPVTEALIKEADFVEGDALIDVAGGSAEPSLTIAEPVGLTESVICTDVVAEMVTAAQLEREKFVASHLFPLPIITIRGVLTNRTNGNLISLERER